MELLAKTAATAGAEQSRGLLEAALLNTSRMAIGTRASTEPLLERIQARAAAGEQLDPLLHANLAIEVAAAGRDRERAVRHARAALSALPALMTASTAALPETISVLVFADHAAEARAAPQEWLRLAQQRGALPSAMVATAVSSLVAWYSGSGAENQPLPADDDG
jgi:hypothetical protein